MVLGSILSGKISIKEIVKNYFTIYCGGFENGKYKKNWFSIFSYGLFPYAVGTFGALAFFSTIKNFDKNILLGINGIFMTMLVVYYGFDIYSRKKDSETTIGIKETNSVNLFALILVIIASILLLYNESNSNEVLYKVIQCIYYSIMTKIFVLIIIILHNTYYLNQKEKHQM